MYCPNCGLKNEPDARFCLNCGTQLSVPQESPNQNEKIYKAETSQLKPGYQTAPVPKKKRKGLIIGLISTGVVLGGSGSCVFRFSYRCSCNRRLVQ